MRSGSRPGLFDRAWTDRFNAAACYCTCNRNGSDGTPPIEVPAKTPTVHVGDASWYGPGFGGKTTASGEVFDETKMTAAHKTLPLGTKAKVTNLKDGKSVQVEINDRGPYAEGRIIDLSQAAAKALGIIDRGVVKVRVESLENPVARGDAQ